MTKVRFLVAGAGAALALGAAALANVAASSMTASDAHGDAVASAARTTCPHGQHGVHGECVSAVASNKSEEKTATKPQPSTAADTCKASDSAEDSSEKVGKKAENTSEKGAKATKSHDRGEDSSEKSSSQSEDNTEKQSKACETSEASD